MNIDKDKLIEMLEVSELTDWLEDSYLNNDDFIKNLTKFADLVSALAIASLQGHTHKNGCVSVPIEPTDAMLKSARVRINQHTNIFTKQLKNYKFDTKG